MQCVKTGSVKICQFDKRLETKISPALTETCKMILSQCGYSVITASPETPDLGQRLATGSEVRWDTLGQAEATEEGGRPGSEPRTRGHPASDH